MGTTLLAGTATPKEERGTIRGMKMIKNGKKIFSEEQMSRQADSDSQP